MTQDDVLFSYRLQLFELAARTTVTNACRTFGVHRSTYYRWKHAVDRQGLEMLRPRERRAALDAQPAADGPRGADHRVLAWAPRPGSQADLCPASTTRVGRAGPLSERGLEGAGAPRDQHARQAPGADRRLPSSLSAARRAPARAAHRRAAPGRARRRGLLLRRSPTRHQRQHLAADGDRLLLKLRLG